RRKAGSLHCGKGMDMGGKSNKVSGPKIIFSDQWSLSSGDQVDLSSSDAIQRLGEMFGRVNDQTDAIQAGIAKLAKVLTDGFERTAGTLGDKLSVVEMEVGFDVKGEGNILLLKAS